MTTLVKIRPVRTTRDYEWALERIDELIDAAPGSTEYDELDILGTLVAEYEEEHYPIPSLDPIDTIKAMLEMRGMRPQDLANILGSKSIASELLNRKRKLELNHIRKINEKLKIPIELLTKEY